MDDSKILNLDTTMDARLLAYKSDKIGYKPVNPLNGSKLY